VTNRVSENLTEADHPQRMADLWQRQLQKSGETEFQVTDVTRNDASVPFMAISAINDLRRTLMTRLREAREQHMLRERESGAMRIQPAPLDQGVNGFENVANTYARRFYERCGATEIEPALETRGDYRGVAVMTSKYCLRRELGMCLKRPSAVNENASLYVRDLDFPTRRLQLRFDCQACEMSVIYESTTPGNH
jgi:23S rRNA 5-hydroxycytidine C2501 synthase